MILLLFCTKLHQEPPSFPPRGEELNADNSSPLGGIRGGPWDLAVALPCPTIPPPLGGGMRGALLLLLEVLDLFEHIASDTVHTAVATDDIDSDEEDNAASDEESVMLIEQCLVILGEINSGPSQNY